jgi:putative ABC transport system permease protein
MIKLEKEVSSKDQENIFDEKNFNLEQLETTNDLNKHHRLITIKETFKKSIKSLFNLDKRSSVMLTIFFLMGMMIAVGLPFINNVLSNRMIFKSDQRNYVQVTGIISSGVNYRFMESLKEEDDDDFYINVFKRVPMVFDIKSIDSLQRPYINTELGIVNHLSESDLVIGRLPNNQYEIAIDFSLVLSDYSRTNSVLRKAGLWNFNQIIGRKIENIYMPNYPFVITGIVNTGANRIYGYKEALVFLNTHLGNNILSSEMFLGNPDFNLNGFMPTPYNETRDYYEVLIPEELFYQYPGIENIDFSNNQIFEVDYKVFATGTYTYNEESFEEIVLMPADDVSYRLFQFSVTQVSFYVHSNNPARFMLDMENEFNNAQTTWPYQNALNEGRIFLLGLRTLMVIGILLIVVSIFSIYFMLKSSLSSKIQEIGILRALGVSKFEIVIEFITDTFVKLSASSILGYILVTLFIDQIDQALIGGSYYFLVTFGSLIIGFFLIYIIAFIGSIPLFRLLKKTPAQLINYYDI